MRKYTRLRSLVRVMYDMQDIRLRTYARIMNEEYRNSLEKDENGNIIAQKSTAEQAAERKALIEQLTREYKSLEKEVEGKRWKSIEKELVARKSKIQSQITWALIKQCVESERQEKYLQSVIKSIVEQIPIYSEHLVNERGCGPTIAAILISEIDIDEARHVSSLWKYAGVDVVNGHGRSKRAEDLVEREYVDKNGDVKTKKGISYNPFLKTKLCGVFASCFIKAGGPYREIYDQAKVRYTNAHPDFSVAHINNMAKRYAVKMFLKNLWNKWRALEGYPPEPDYWEQYISGRAHGEGTKKEEEDEVSLNITEEDLLDMDL